MKKILIIRPQPDARDFADLCRAKRFEPVIAPLMEIIFAEKPVDVRGVSGLAFTSANGVRAFARNCDGRDLPVFAVGEATGKAAREQGFQRVAVAGGDVGMLAALIGGARADIAGEILHIAGSDRAGDLIELLRQRAIAARREVLYDTLAAAVLPMTAQAALTGTHRAQWAVLFSPRTAALFSQLVISAGLKGEMKNIRAACLSAAVASAASGLPWHEIHIADRRNSGAMIALMENNA